MPETKCDICKRWFTITNGMLHTETVTVINKTGEHRLQVTEATCPLCGKTYPVVIDDAETIKLKLSVEELLRKQLKYIQNNRPAPMRLLAKIDHLNWKLDFKRQNLAKKYNGSFYQTDEGKQQLDYRYHVR